MKRPFLVIASALTLAGCYISTTKSDPPPRQPKYTADYTTAEIWPSTSAESYGGGIKVYAALLKGSDFLTLSEGEYFTATMGTETIVLAKQPFPDEGKVRYEASFAPRAEATEVTLALVRLSGKTAAPSSKTIVPAPFAITSPTPVSIRLGQPLKLTVSPAPKLDAKTDPARAYEWMTVSVTGSCLKETGAALTEFDAEGNATFDTTKLQLKDAQTTGCDVHVQVRHEYGGPADKAFDSGRLHVVEGVQARGFGTALVR